MPEKMHQRWVSWLMHNYDQLKGNRYFLDKIERGEPFYHNDCPDQGELTPDEVQSLKELLEGYARHFNHELGQLWGVN